MPITPSRLLLLSKLKILTFFWLNRCLQPLHFSNGCNILYRATNLLFISYLSDIKNGRDAGIISEAGAPGVADPGSNLVLMAHSQDIEVVPLVGPSSILLGLMASGFNGQSFCFHGYLPRTSSERCKKIRRLEESSRKFDRTELFIETPHRNRELAEDIIRTCNPKTKFCTCSNLSLPDEQIISKSISWWQRHKRVKSEKEPPIFLLYAG